VVTKEEWKKAYEKMRSVAREALEFADRGHGGHSWESIRSQEAQKCCEMRMAVNDLKVEFTKLAQSIDVRELPKRKSR